ncbi:MAG: hypothetical protein K0R62_6824 [Nonomuraea muscovyensis]|nr:hypothetical protein [Nonomuraea muscovyensis]
MWQRGLNWAAVVLVGVFGLMWLGVVMYADGATPLWLRVGEAVFGVFLTGWAVRKTAVMFGKA